MSELECAKLKLCLCKAAGAATTGAALVDSMTADNLSLPSPSIQRRIIVASETFDREIHQCSADWLAELSSAGLDADQDAADDEPAAEPNDQGSEPEPEPSVLPPPGPGPPPGPPDKLPVG